MDDDALVHFLAHVTFCSFLSDADKKAFVERKALFF